MEKKVFCVVFLTLTVFMSTNSSYAGGKIGIPKTGETVTYGGGDDGALQKGVAWPSPRFTDNGNGTVTDNLTSLIWLKDANCFGAQTWANALAQANSLANGACSGGLTDGSVAGDWRLPNRNELESLVDASKYSPALPSGNPFMNVQLLGYWSSTTWASGTADAWYVPMYDGYLSTSAKSATGYVWPVRGGQ